VVLATPLSKNDWLAERLARFGPAPCAYLIGAASLEAASKRFHVADSVNWFDERVVWFDAAALNGTRIGIIQSRDRKGFDQ
jgi:hypothetical protein